MTENRYLAKDSPDAFECERLALLTRIADPITTRRLADLGVGPGWRCLDVGAGSGTVPRWLAERVGPQGRVVATDLNPRFLGGHRLANLEVRRHNILEDELEAAHYDLVHCRALLMHLPGPIRALRRLAEAVRPGGWLLVEEAAGSASFGAADPGHRRAAGFDRRTRALLAAVKATGTMDLDFGRRLPALFERIGVRDLGHEGVTLIGRGGDPQARFNQMTDELLRDRIVAAGVLTEADFDELKRAYDDASFWFVGYTLFGAWGRRAGQGGALHRPRTRSPCGPARAPGVFPGDGFEPINPPRLILQPTPPTWGDDPRVRAASGRRWDSLARSNSKESQYGFTREIHPLARWAWPAPPPHAGPQGAAPAHPGGPGNPGPVEHPHCHYCAQWPADAAATAEDPDGDEPQ
jgi:SAM-dependent methyltransferase